MRLTGEVRKKLIVGTMSLWLIAGSGGLVYFAFRDSSLLQVVEKSTAQTKYVLVNEDDGQEFEGVPYQLGNDFVTFISQDTKNKWETADRNNAERGLENGQYDAMIIIPHNFSSNVLSLQSISPEKANIEYKIRNGQTQVTNQVIQNNVNSVLYDFNKKIVQMYFSSIIGSLANAQQNLNEMMEVGADQKAFLVSNIQNPFQALPDSFSMVSSLAASLQSSTDAVEAQQKSFMDAMNNMMQEREQNISSPSASLTTSNQGSDSQVSPTTPGLIDPFYQRMTEQMLLLKQDASQDDSTNVEQDDLYTRFLKQSVRFQENQGERHNQLDRQIQSLNAQVANLKGILGNIASKYYGDSAKTPDTATTEDAKLSLASMMNGREDSKLATDYLNQTDAMVQTVPLGNLGSVIDYLRQKSALTDEQANAYNSKIQLLNKYASERGIGSGGTSFTLADASSSEQATTAQMTTTLKVSSSGDTLSLTGDGVTLLNGSAIASQIQTSLNQQLAPFNRQATVSSNGNSISVQVVSVKRQEVEAVIPEVQDTSTRTPGESSQASQENSGNVSSDNTLPSSNTTTPETSSSSSENSSTNKLTEPQAVPDAIPLTVDVQLSVTPNDQSEQGYIENTYQWSNQSGVLVTGKVGTVRTEDNSVEKNLPNILSNFSSVDQAAQQVTTLYGEPSEDVLSFSGRSAGSSAPLSQLASSQSVFYRYNNSELQSLAANISEDFAQSYKNDGDQLYRAVASQVSDLEAFLGNENSDPSEDSLYGQLKTLGDTSTYFQLLTDLSDWKKQTMELLDNQYQSMKTDEKTQSPEDQERLTAATEQLKALQNSTQRFTSDTNNAADSIVSDNSAIRQFSSTTQQLQSDANNLLGSVNQYATDTATSLSENKAYTEAFNKVLANTRNGGADNLRVFNFLASPIDITAIQGTTARLSIIPYYMTMVGAFVMAMTSYFISAFMKARVITEKDKLTTPTRLWLNTPNNLRIIGISFGVSVAYAAITTTLVKGISPLSWLLYTFLVMETGILFFTFTIRQVRKTLAFDIFALLMGLYLMLMPIIGTSTKSGSLLSLLYRFSPFQNMENGYTAMINGVQIGWLTLLALLCLIIIAISLNWIVKTKDPLKSEE